MATRADEPPPDTAPIDVVVPVYNAPDDLARCVQSVLAHTQRPYRLVLIDDGSPDERIGRYFAALAQRALPHVTLLANERNLGFIATANRGMELSRADVVLLNSDTLVTAGWLDALARCAASDSRIGTITPFSNNAEICSFPRFCVDNPWPPEADPEPVRAALARAAVPTWPDLPTGVGFCLYIRRALIDAIGTFDPVFGPGYGEENDFCLRAARASYRNVLCDDAFVLHLGGRSFVGRKAELGARNLGLLLERHPGYVDLVREYIAADPVRPVRDAALAQLRAATGPARGVLHVVHGHGGGTEHHARSLIDTSREAFRHYLAVAVGDDWQVEEHLDGGSVRTFNLRRREDESWPAFVGGLCATFRIGFAHLHNISGCRDGIIAALDALGLPYGYTAHDLSFACPTVLFLGADGRYCFEQTDRAICRACLGAQPAFAHLDIVDWRRCHGALLARAAFVIAPSRWVASALTRYYPDCAVEVIPHGPPGAWAMEPGRNMPALEPRARVGLPMPDDDLPTVAVLGAVGPDKGARQLERLVAIARATRASVRFVLIGYMDVQHGPWQSDDAIFTVHGRYDPPDLPQLLAHYRARLVAFPSAGPETFSFTLSEAWSAGLPVVVPPFGALAERVAGTGAGWIWTEAEWRDEARMLARIVELVAPANADALAMAVARARTASRPTVAAMTQRTLELYDRITPAVPAKVAVLDPARVRDALGYVAWTPSRGKSAPQARASNSAAAVSVPMAAAPTDVVAPSTDILAAMARAGLRWRHSLPGRVLHRLAPARFVEALKSRLR